MNENKKPTSLFLYTALIFLVALIMIVLSFFGQNHYEENEKTQQQAKTLTEKASIISEENLNLTEQVSDLTETIENHESTISEQNTQIEALNNKTAVYEMLISAYERLYENKKDEALAIIEQIDSSVLTTDDAINLYNQIKELVRKEDQNARH